MKRYQIKKEKFYTTPRIGKLIKKYSQNICLDAGCGTGEYFKFFNTNTTIYGIDIRQDYLDKINTKKYKVQKIVLKKADVKKLPFKNEMFDFLVSVAVLEYMKDGKELSHVVKEMKRVIKNGGVLVVSTPHKNGFTQFVRKEVIGRVLKQDAQDPYFIMGKEYSRETLEKFGFRTYGCLGWVTWRNIPQPVAKIADMVLWRLPIFSGTLIGVYEKK